MDWKEILSSKVASGELPHQEVEESVDNDTPDKVKQTDKIQVILDRKGRKGKVATLIVGFTCDDNELKEVASTLKSKLATGGSSRGGEILIQGDRVNDVKVALKDLGYSVK